MAFKWDTDRIISITAMVIGIGSLLTIAYQASLMRQAQHASVLPYLYISLNANDRTGVRLLLTNSGIGPALVDEVHIRYQGRDFNGDPYDFILAQRPDIAKMRIGVDKVQTGRLIPAGATIQMVDLGPAVGQKVLPDVLRLFEIAEVPRACTPRSAPQARTRRWSKSRTSPCTAIDGGSGRIGSCRKGCERIGLES